MRGIQFRRKHTAVLSLVDEARETDRELNRLFEERRELEDAGRSVDRVTREIDRAVDRFNRKYNERIGAREL